MLISIARKYGNASPTLVAADSVKQPRRTSPRHRPYNPPAPDAQVVEHDVDRGEDDQRHHGGEEQAADDGAGHGVVVRSVAADLRVADSQRDQAQHRGSRRHNDGTEAFSACLHDGFVAV